MQDSPEDKKPRSKLTNLKFHCAMHKDDETKHCLSHNYVPLKKLTFDERQKLFKENGDCLKCARDCLRTKCKMARMRVCGGEKDSRGSGKCHEGHKLFCKDAKLCMVTIVTVTSAQNVDMDGAPTLLQVMKIPQLDYDTL